MNVDYSSEESGEHWNESRSMSPLFFSSLTLLNINRRRAIHKDLHVPRLSTAHEWVLFFIKCGWV